MNPKGFGFAEFTADDHRSFPPRTSASDTLPTSAFIPPALLRDIVADDQVLVAYTLESDGRATVTSAAVTTRTRDAVFGTVVDLDGELRLRTDPHVAHMTLTLVRPSGLRAGMAALCSLDSGPDGTAVAGTPFFVFDDADSVPAVHARMLSRYRIPITAPEASPTDGLRAAAVPDAPAPRRDLRDLTTITIDADSSRDLDDALSVYPSDEDGAIRVLVHIADVADAVQPGSHLDTVAAEISTSVYLPGANRPMLPRELSEDRLSLLPGADRNTLTAELRIDAQGVVTAVDLFETVIRSTMRLSYETAAAVLAGQAPAGVPEDVTETLRWLRTAGSRLALQRGQRGGVDSRRVEPEREVAYVDGELTTRATIAQNDANLLIERLMVAANEGVASWLAARGLPGLYRVHDVPGPEAAQDLETFATNLGFRPGFGPSLTPLSLAAFDHQVSCVGDPRTDALWNVMLGHLGRARYQVAQGGHFGLGSDLYLHFTSPIRRYADLVVHRVVKAYLAGARRSGQLPSTETLRAIADRCNDGARRAARAEGDARKAMWIVALLREDDALTKLREGLITSVTEKGMFVVLDGSVVSGFLSFRNLPGGPWRLDGHRAAGPTTSYELGGSVRVRIAAMDATTGQIELSAATQGRRPVAGQRGPHRSRRRQAA